MVACFYQGQATQKLRSCHFVFVGSTFLNSVSHRSKVFSTEHVLTFSLLFPKQHTVTTVYLVFVIILGIISNLDIQTVQEVGYTQVLTHFK